MHSWNMRILAVLMGVVLLMSLNYTFRILINNRIAASVQPGSSTCLAVPRMARAKVADYELDPETRSPSLWRVIANAARNPPLSIRLPAEEDGELAGFGFSSRLETAPHFLLIEQSKDGPASVRNWSFRGWTFDDGIHSMLDQSILITQCANAHQRG